MMAEVPSPQHLEGVVRRGKSDGCSSARFDSPAPVSANETASLKGLLYERVSIARKVYTSQNQPILIQEPWPNEPHVQ